MEAVECSTVAAPVLERAGALDVERPRPDHAVADRKAARNRATQEVFDSVAPASDATEVHGASLVLGDEIARLDA